MHKRSPDRQDLSVFVSVEDLWGRRDPESGWGGARKTDKRKIGGGGDSDCVCD